MEMAEQMLFVRSNTTMVNAQSFSTKEGLIALNTQ